MQIASNAEGATPHAAERLVLDHFPAGENGFFRAPVLISGRTETLLVDGGFTYADGDVIAEAIHATGKKLKAIYVSQSDPDYYFNLGPIQRAFPETKIFAAKETVSAIQASVSKKLEVWGPQLKENGPQSLNDIVMPIASDQTVFTVDREAIEVISVVGLANRRYLWIPTLKAILGGVLVFSGVHVWTADTATAEARDAWVKALDAMAELHPEVVVPGHMAVSAPVNASAIAYTRSYLLAFEEELAKATSSDALIAAMTQRYPDAGMQVAIQIGAKVARNEMKWG